MKHTKLILGLVGEMAAGKTTVTDYIKEKHGGVSFRFSDMLGDILARMHIEKTRENYQTLSTILRQNFGDDIMSKVIMLDVKASENPLIITEGVRRPSDIEYLKELPGFHLVAIQADEKIRFERTTERSEKPDDQSKTWEQFQAEGKQESEQKIKDIAAKADYTIDNNGSLEELYKQVDEIITQIRG